MCSHGFAGECYVHDDDGFEAWRDANPKGFVLNSEIPPSANFLVLHRADCHFLATHTKGDQEHWTTYAKHCSLDRGAILAWATPIGDVSERCHCLL